MHPSYSVILFTTTSGAGYGLMAWFCLALLTGGSPEGWAGITALTLALALVTFGLLSSTFHLGHPERAHRALSQWKSSWLSREGVAAVATYGPAGLLWLSLATGHGQSLVPAFALLSLAGALGTVWCTGMIYASLKTVPEWYRQDVAPLYLVLALATGAVLLAFLFGISGGTTPTWLIFGAVAVLLSGLLLKRLYWSAITDMPMPYTTEQATGLGYLGRVSTLDPPHTSPNFVMREMGYRVARKNADKLRRISTLSLFVVPSMMLIASAFLPIPALFATLAVVSAALGILVERWLFFAEARHVSMLYYGGH